MSYALYTDVEARLNTVFTTDERNQCNVLLADAAVLIDAYNEDADTDAKKVVSCRVVLRAMANSSVDMPIGSTQGSVSALGYSQSWTVSNGASGELYLNKTDKRLLGVGNRIGTYSQLENV